jgi:hypothetical protein
MSGPIVYIQNEKHAISYEFFDYYACFFSHHIYICNLYGATIVGSKEDVIGGICCNTTW